MLDWILVYVVVFIFVILFQYMVNFFNVAAPEDEKKACDSDRDSSHHL